MDTDSSMKWKNEVNLIENVLDRPLSAIQYIVITGILEKRGYQEIANESGYSRGYIAQEGAVILKKLSNRIQRRVTKKSLLYLLTNRRPLLEAWAVIGREENPNDKHAK